MLTSRRLTLAVVLTAFFHDQTPAEIIPYDRFLLFNECAPIDLVVEGLPPAAADIGLTKERIQILAESRLRAARLFDEEARPYLYVNIGVLVPTNRGAFNTAVSFNKELYDPISNLSYRATTWRTGGLGSHGGDAGFIMQSLSELLDRFVLEYLRVNETACGNTKKKADPPSKG